MRKDRVKSRGESLARRLRKGARSEATSRALLVIVVCGMCEERSDELVL